MDSSHDEDDEGMDLVATQEEGDGDGDHAASAAAAEQDEIAEKRKEEEKARQEQRKVILRNYQQAALSKALKQNIIMCGASGIGKTHVAMALLREADYSGGRLAFFLATTRNLAEQQSQRIRNGTSLTVKLCVGMDLDLWSKVQWQDIFNEYQVVLSTPQVLVNLLDKGSEYMSMKRINLLIMDECHKAHRNHPYTKVMSHYDRAEVVDRPRVFGMTATPTPTCHMILRCYVHVCALEDVKVYAAKAPVMVTQYQKLNPATTTTKMMKALIEKGRQHVDDMVVEGGEEEAGQMHQEDGSGFMDDGRNSHTEDKEGHQEQEQTKEEDLLNKVVEVEEKQHVVDVFMLEVRQQLPHLSHLRALDAEKIKWTYDTIGSWFGLRHLQLIFDHWTGVRGLKDQDQDPAENFLARKLAMYLKSALSKTLQSGIKRSDRMEKLITCLRQRFEQDTTNFRAIVFIQRRVACRVLFEYINAIAPFKNICGFAIGQSTSSGLAAYGLRGQKYPVHDFSLGRTKVLIATDVLSEGIDIPECSLVIAFDEVPNPTAFVQMRGRARNHDDGAFVLFAGDSEGLGKIFSLQLGAARFEIGATVDGAIRPSEQPMSRIYPQFTFQVPSTGAILNLENSVSFLNQVCQWTRECQSYGLTPVFEMYEHLVPNHPVGFRCILTMPPIFGLPPFESEAFPAKAVARAVAAYFACVALYENKIIDNDLNRTIQSVQLENFRDYIKGISTQLTNERAEIITLPKENLGLEPLAIAPSSTSGEVMMEGENAEDTYEVYVYPFEGTSSCIGLVTRNPVSGEVLQAEEISAMPPSVETISAKQLELLKACHAILMHYVIHGANAFLAEPATEGPLVPVVRIVETKAAADDAGDGDNKKERRESKADESNAEESKGKEAASTISPAAVISESPSTEPIVEQATAAGSTTMAAAASTAAIDPIQGQVPPPAADSSSNGIADVTGAAAGGGNGGSTINGNADADGGGISNGSADATGEPPQQETSPELANENAIPAAAAAPTAADEKPNTKEKRKKRKKGNYPAAIDDTFYTNPIVAKDDFDKGYVLSPLLFQGEEEEGKASLNWEVIRRIVEQPPSRKLVVGGGWPLPEGHVSDWLLLTHVPNSRRNRLWGGVQVTETTLAQAREAAALAAAARREKAAAASAAAEAVVKTEKEGKEGIKTEERVATGGNGVRDERQESAALASADTESMEVHIPSDAAMVVEPSTATALKKRARAEGSMLVEVAQSTVVNGQEVQKETTAQVNGEGHDELVAMEDTDENGRSKRQKVDGVKEEEQQQPKPGEEKPKRQYSPRLHLFEYHRENWNKCDPEQSLLLVEKLEDSQHQFRIGAKDGLLGETTEAAEIKVGRTGQTPMKRLLAPQTCTVLIIPKSVYNACQRALPLLWRLEIGLKIDNIIKRVGVPLKNPKILREALCKPDYERLEVMGDAYLKFCMGIVVLRREPFLERESLLHDFRANLVCNKRLLEIAQGHKLHGSITLRRKVMNEPFQNWSPSLLAPLSTKASSVHGKVVADVVESLLGAYLIDGGPAAADQFLKWIGLPVSCRANCTQLEKPLSSSAEHWPIPHRDCRCWSAEALASAPSTIFPKPTPQPAIDITSRLAKFEALLKYTFNNKWLALMALTHPSHNRKMRRTDQGEGHTVLIADYQRLEFLGDALLDYLIITKGFFEHGEKTPDRLHDYKKRIVNNDHLARRGMGWLQLHRFLDSDSIELNRNVEMFVNCVAEKDHAEEGGPKALADVLEAIIASVFIDSGGNLDLLYRTFVLSLQETSMEEDLGNQGGEGLLENEVGEVLTAEEEEEIRRKFPSLCAVIGKEGGEGTEDHLYAWLNMEKEEEGVAVQVVEGVGVEEEQEEEGEEDDEEQGVDWGELEKDYYYEGEAGLEEQE